MPGKRILMLEDEPEIGDMLALFCAVWVISSILRERWHGAASGLAGLPIRW